VLATDAATKQVGGAGASCVEVIGASLFNAAHVSVPGKSVLHAQGLVAAASVLDKDWTLMAEDTLPRTVLDTIATPEVDPGELADGAPFANYRLRQYGIADLVGNTAGYTGEDLDPLYEVLGNQPSFQTDQQGRVGNYSYSAQGNVVSEQTVPILASTFEQGLLLGNTSDVTADDLVNDVAADDCDFVQRLWDAVMAVYENEEGDTRCPEHGAAVAFLHVEHENGDDLFHWKAKGGTLLKRSMLPLRNGG